MNKSNSVDRFLLENAGAVNGLWQGSLAASCQRTIFDGRYFGEGRITVDGSKRRIIHQRPSDAGKYETTIVATY